jgi:hypothetical protein
MAENGGEGRGFCAFGIARALVMLVVMCIRHPRRMWESMR